MTKNLHQTIKSPILRARVRALIAIASFNVFWEKLWPGLFPPLAVLGFFWAAALLDFLPRLPFWLHILVLLSFAGFLAYSIRGLLAANFRVPETQAHRRLEKDSKASHRPLESLGDKPIGENLDPNTAYVWRAHQSRRFKELKKLKVGFPSPGMARRDPYGFRVVFLLALVIAGSTGINDSWARLERALVPELGLNQGVIPSVNVWITPPSYTGLAPIFLENQFKKKLGGPSSPPSAQDAEEQLPIRVPVGSNLLGQLSAANKNAELVIGQRRINFESSDPHDASVGARAEGVITALDVGVSRLNVNVGNNTMIAWPIKIEADQLPQVEFLQAPGRDRRGMLKIQFEARDDFGINDVGIVIRHSQGWHLPDGKVELNIKFPIQKRGSPIVKGVVSQDLMDHPWAGSRVDLRLHTSDSARQVGSSKTLSLVLPERVFNHPVARAIIAARKKLNQFESQTILEVSRDIEKIAMRPAHFSEDMIVFLNLAISRSRLLQNGSLEAVGSVQELLWKTAVRLEDGEFAVAERSLEGAQRELLEAFRNSDMSGPEINRLMNQLQKAMENYMRALKKRLKSTKMTNMPQNPVKEMMESGDLQRIIKQIRELTRTGSFDAAKHLFARLNKMLKALRNSARTAGKTRGPSQGSKMLKRLRELSNHQQKLLDDTFSQLQPKSMFENRQPSFGIASQQERLRRDLKTLMKKMNEIIRSVPLALKKADRAMKGAKKSLARGKRLEAVKRQTEALGELNKATERLAERLARRMNGKAGFSLGRQSQQWQGNRDPFGRRPMGDGAYKQFGDGAVKIPTEREIRRSREILDELRLRSSDRRRPDIELKYIERLMKQF